jgi:glycosyltransferase involved in cell wall biosynthesis
MRVLHIDTEMSWRGGQQQAVYLYEEMLKRGFETCFICRPGSRIAEYFLSRNLPYKQIPFWGEWDFFHGLRLALWAKQERYNILHLHSAHALSWGLWTKIFFPKLRLVAVKRVCTSVKRNPLSSLKYKNKLLDVIITISDTIRQGLIADGLEENKIITVYSGIDPDKFSKYKMNNKDADSSHDSLRLGTIAAFTREKDYPNYLRAASLVIRERPAIHFLAAGDGYLLPEMKKLAKELGITANFTFTGFQSDIGKYLASIDIFVLASRKEGLGTSVLDAQAVGLPVIATKTGGIPEIISDGVNGILVEPGNPGKLAAAILNLADNPKRRKQLGDKAKETVQNFSIEKTVEKNIMVYKELFDDKSR